MRYISLTERLILNILSLGIIIIAILTSFSYYSAQSLLLNRTFEQLSSVRSLKKNQIESFFNERVKEAKFLAQSGEIQEFLKLLNNGNNNRISLFSDNFKKNELFSNFIFLKGYYSKALIIGNDNLILNFSYKKEGFNYKISKLSDFDPFFLKFVNEIRINKSTLLSDFTKVNSPEHSIYIGNPVFDSKNQIQGYLLLELPFEMLDKMILDSKNIIGMGQSGETYLVGSDFLMRSESRFFNNSILKKKVNTVASQKALNGMEGTEIIDDYRNIRVLSAYTPIDILNLKWALIVEIDIKEAYIGISKLRNYILFISIISVLILFIATYIIALKISKPLVNLKNDVLRISMGGINKPLLVNSNDEIGALKSAFNNLMSHLDMQNKELQEERSLRLKSVIDGQEMERQRLSRELHDGLGQMLIAIKLKLEGLIYTDRSKLLYTISGIQKLFDSTIEEVKRISYDLSPAVLHEFGLSKAIRNLCEEIEARTKIAIKLDFDCDTEKLSNLQQTYLFRIIQEAINNVVKHSEATLVTVDLKLKEDIINLKIADNGKGFKLEERVKTSQSRGIYNMKERVNLLKGEFNLSSEPGKGTIIEVNIDLTQKIEG
jgi:signal transduction histidine kinase